VVVEIELAALDESLFYPDEDFISHALLTGGQLVADLERGHKKARSELRRFQHLWHGSLLRFGNFAYRGTVPTAALRRYARLDVSHMNSPASSSSRCLGL
jgi:hypothetical protein